MGSQQRLWLIAGIALLVLGMVSSVMQGREKSTLTGLHVQSDRQTQAKDGAAYFQ